jgi:hypothetical protein
MKYKPQPIRQYVSNQLISSGFTFQMMSLKSFFDHNRQYALHRHLYNAIEDIYI